MNKLTPALHEQGKGLGNDSHTSNSSTQLPTKSIKFNRLTTLGDICDSWVACGFYRDPDRALNVLVRELR